MDILETTYQQPGLEEFILVTKDSDFIPVIQRLGAKSKRTVVLVDESRPSVDTAFATHADILIPVRKLADATQYERQSRGWRIWFGSRAGQEPAQRPTASAPPRPAPEQPRKAPPENDPMEQVVIRVVRVASRKPRLYTAQKEIEKELLQLAGFTRTGKQSHLGKGSYRALMLEVGRRNKRIEVRPQGNGGAGVLYVPQDEV